LAPSSEEPCFILQNCLIVACADANL
jgi:hypothetical protein